MSHPGGVERFPSHKTEKSCSFDLMSQRANAPRPRRKSVRRRRTSTNNTLAQILLAATVVTCENTDNAAAISAKTMSNSVVPRPLEFMRQTTAVAVPVKRKRQNQIDQLDEPLQTKYLALGRTMMKRDRLLQQIWQKSKATDAQRKQIAVRLQEVNKAIGALGKEDTSRPTTDQV